jgi:pimeloyl-ACP methyl ester carboxylesterase
MLLLPLADGDRPPTLAELTGSPEALAVSGRVFSGDFSEPTMEAFGRLVAPYYAGPRHPQVPGTLLSLSHFAAEVARYFFQVLAPTYDLRPRLAEIDVPALVLVGAYDWICPSAGSRLMTRTMPRATLVEFAEAGHFPFSEEPAAFARAVGNFLTELEERLTGLLERV